MALGIQNLGIWPAMSASDRRSFMLPTSLV